MRPSKFIPARDTRHRTAVLALYSALLRSATQVPLASPAHPMRNPIVYLLRQRFAKNKRLDSSRLIYAAMSAGYNFTSVLEEARIEGSSQHSRVLKHIQTSRIPEGWLRGDMPKRFEAPLHKTRSGIIQKVTNPDGTFEYVPSGKVKPKDFQNLRGRDPSVSLTNEGIPFIRLRKPQPIFLGKQIGKKREAIMQRNQRSVDAKGGEMNLAIDEDVWEKIIAQQARNEGQTEGWNKTADTNLASSFRWTAALQGLWYTWRNERDSVDHYERAKALQKISDSLFEEKDKLTGRRKFVDKNMPKPTFEVPANITKDKEQSPYVRKALQAAGALPTPDTADPYAHPSWSGVVEKTSKILERDILRHAALPKIPDLQEKEPKRAP